ncbi:AraC-type DNA-binding protein [Collimonas sp. OK307]|uniref:AraC family transcriptional regulator n=1 Tax=Collimonas sp. OK307 TaxID=1801620 RepID=UPI0008EC0A09|nr:AraC family transcriptional regulator [Collimonas sp. OK307]SFI00220.1 AraC-type DNA-binding protein [Collimonas sp. OK307]
MLNPPVTISVAFVRGMLSGICAGGASSEECLLQAGIPLALLDEPEGRVTAEQYVALFEVLMKQHDDEGLGFFSRPLRHGSLAFVMRSTLGATTVETAIRRLCSGFQLLQDDVQFDVVREDQLTGLRIIVPTAYYPDRIFVHELLLRIISRLVVWLHGGRIRPFGFDFAYPSPPQANEYYKLFVGRVRFDQPQSAMWFPTANLLTAMRRDEAALRDFLLQSPRNVVIPQRNDDATSERIRTYLQKIRPQWPDLPATADALHMSVSTLQRHLADEGSSFQMVKDQLRRDLAIMRLNTSTVQLATLAAELGFSDQAVFQRAFKTWTGSAPGTYRQRR